MNKSSWLFILLMSVMAGSTNAGTMGADIQQNDWTWVGAISMGPVWNNGGDGQTFFLAPEIEKTYTSNKSTNALFDGEVFIGLQKTMSQMILSQLGIAVAATSNATLSGHIWDDGNPEFDNYIYRYSIQHTHVAVKGKLLVDNGYWMIPWISGSLGVGFNNAHSFDSRPTIFEALPTPNFKSHSETSFTYTVGAGVQKALNQHWQLGVGYEFADWGKSRLGRANGQTLNSGLTQNHLYTNGILFNLTYIA